MELDFLGHFKYIKVQISKNSHTCFLLNSDGNDQRCVHNIGSYGAISENRAVKKKRLFRIRELCDVSKGVHMYLPVQIQAAVGRDRFRNEAQGRTEQPIRTELMLTVT